ncbi:hydroxypyruvate isomerase family protein [Sedimentimonas flavescens]|uniref:hydroxypyruvate isomerase family protein n=1 Tax=Sedimentimonas flavescens TaxID=2851012 RepID=UPI001C49E2E7|nr:TIM barrel protein [Sedimentimonas flavescens]MBW0158678.1 TIM barrel protein [Sedimentimonas flavescens]
MPRFAANLTFLFTERPFLDRFAAARAAGFDAVEALFPYDHPAQSVRDRLDAASLHLVLINTPAADWADGGRGCAAIPGQEDRFRREFAQAQDYAEALGAGLVHIMSGLASGPEARECYLRNLEWAAAQVPARRLTIEPINPIDMPGYFLNDFTQAGAILNELAAPNLHLQFDAYHAHRIIGDVNAAWRRYGQRAAHIQIAGYPGRQEPTGGLIDYPAFFSQLDAEGYVGHVSAEYFPAGDTAEGLGWFSKAKG